MNIGHTRFPFNASGSAINILITTEQGPTRPSQAPDSSCANALRIAGGARVRAEANSNSVGGTKADASKHVRDTKVPMWEERKAKEKRSIPRVMSIPPLL